MQLNDIQDITDSLALMPDPALQQYAQMHKDDPYVMSLAMSESSRRKKMRAAQQGQAGQMPQPKVVDQAIAAMNPPPQRMMPPQQMAPQGAPQGQGIAQLPTPNLQGMADGGIAGYDDEEDVQGMARGGNAGSDPTAAYRQYALAQAAKMGLDPSLVDSIFKIESGYNPNAKSEKGAVGIGQLMPKTSAGQGVTDATDAYQNIDASLREMKGLQTKYGNDPNKIAAAYNWGQGNLDKHLRTHEGELDTAKLPSETQGYLKKLSTMLTAAVPIGSAQAAENIPVAPSPAGSGSVIGKQITSGLSSAGKGLADLVNPTNAGYMGEAGIEPELAQEAIKQQTQAAQNQKTGEFDSGAGTDWENINPASGAASDKQRAAAMEANVAASNMPFDKGSGGENWDNPQEIIAAAKETADPAVSKGWTNDDWLTFGLAALGTDSPNFLQGIGKAGLVTQQQRQARTQQEATNKYHDALAKQALANAAFTEDERGPNALRMKALSLASTEYNAWLQSPAAITATDEQKAAYKKKLTAEKLQDMGLSGTMNATANDGFVVKGSRPAG